MTTPQTHNDLKLFRRELPSGWELMEIYCRDVGTSYVKVAKDTDDVEMSVVLWRGHGVPIVNLAGRPTPKDLKELDKCRDELERFSKKHQY